MSTSAPKPKSSPFAPLSEKVFRRIWTASIFANLGQLILGVGVAWEMTRLTNSSTMVALVQTAMMLPQMLAAQPAGAIADMYDRRKISISGLSATVFFAVVLCVLAFNGLTTPWMLLAFLVLIGLGIGFYYPAWSASIGEQVKLEALPAAIALNSISFNVARSFGPAVGGLIVLAAGAKAAFAVTAVAYLPLIFALFLWKREQIPSRLPRETISRAIVSGLRYALHSSPVRIVLFRIFIFTFSSYTAIALAPLIAKDLLGGNASTYGILLGGVGVGAVIGALLINVINEHFGAEKAATVAAIVSGLSLLGTGLSHSLYITCLMMFFSGGAMMVTVSLLNVTIQLSIPRWVIARALALFSSLLTGGIAIGSWFWGSVADLWSIEVALIGAGICMLLLPAVALLARIPSTVNVGAEAVDLSNEPEVNLAINMRSGPVVIEIEYRVDPDNARLYYGAMQKMRRVRLRNGAFNWSITRDIADPALWIERFHLATWGDYLRMRDRSTQADINAQAEAEAFLMSGEAVRIRRGLERPFGSVRWKITTPDTKQDSPVYLGL